MNWMGGRSLTGTEGWRRDGKDREREKRKGE